MSEKIIKTLHPHLQYLGRKLKFEMKSRYNIDIIIYCGLRSFATQTNLYNQGRINNKPIVTNAKAGYSNHNYDEVEGSYAFDASPLNASGKCDWGNIDAFKKMGVVAKEIGLVWGGDFRSITDYPHLEFTQGLTTTQLRNGERIKMDKPNVRILGSEKYVKSLKNVNGITTVELRELFETLNLKVGYVDGIVTVDLK